MVGWENIYEVKKWMKKNEEKIVDEVEKMKKEGMVKEMMIKDEKGNEKKKIKKIKQMIEENMDEIVIDEGQY